MECEGVCGWMIVRKQMRVTSVYEPHAKGTEAERQTFRDEVESMMVLVQVVTMVCLKSEL